MSLKETSDTDDRPAPTDAGSGESSGPTDGDRAPLSKDVVFELLQVSRRRETLRYLRSNGDTANLSDLAEHIAALENGIDERALSSSQRKRVYIALYQCHLPKMDDVGVIEYEQARGRIELRPESAQLFLYLDRVPDRDDSESRSPLSELADLIRP